MNLEIVSTEVRFMHLNVRTEKHGTDDVTAIDVKLKWTTSNEALRQFHPDLLAALYGLPNDAQLHVEGAPPVHTVRLFSDLAPLHWLGEVNAAVLTMHHGLGEAEDLILGGCAADSFVIEPLDGGTVSVTFRVRAVCEDERILGRLPLLLERSLPMTLRSTGEADAAKATPKKRKISGKLAAANEPDLLNA